MRTFTPPYSQHIGGLDCPPEPRYVGTCEFCGDLVEEGDAWAICLDKTYRGHEECVSEKWCDEVITVTQIHPGRVAMKIRYGLGQVADGDTPEVWQVEGEWQ